MFYLACFIYIILFDISMFKLNSEDSGARLGKLKTKHGTIQTPFFMPIATKGTAKQVSPEELKQLGSDAIIANAFVLYLKPGLEIIRKFRGIHKFMKWDKVIFTDSGGFQILSKSFLHKSNDKGVYFKNPFNGDKEFLSPEDVMMIEQEIGADVAMTLDFVPHYYGSSKKYIIDCVNKTHSWAERCVKSHNDKKQLLFGIAQGGTFRDLREKSTKFINNLDFDGVAMGGLCFGESRDLMFRNVKAGVKHIDKNKTRYLMGVGSPEDLIEAISLGIDCFDSRFPTMNARHGGIFTKKGKIDITKVKFKDDGNPLDENCRCYTCKNFSRAYIHHLYRTYEPIRDRYGNIHNLYFIQKLIKDIRKAIKNNEFKSFKREFLKNYKFNKNKKTKFTYC